MVLPLCEVLEVALLLAPGERVAVELADCVLLALSVLLGVSMTVPVPVPVPVPALVLLLGV